MFEIFKRKTKRLTAEDLTRLSETACAEVQAKWIQFNETIHLKEDESLAQKIDLFAQPISQFFQTKYPQLLAGGSEIFWLTLFTAVQESGTHSSDQVNAAVATLQGIYGGKR
jgi:oligoendopeptidase F